MILPKRTTILLLFSLLVSWTGASPVPRSNEKFDRLLVFGDSESDFGNVYAMTNGVWPPSVYYHGSFSDGLMWDQYLAEALGVNVTSYAYGSATSDSTFVQGYVVNISKATAVPGLVQQADTFAQQTGPGENLKDALAVAWLAGNDYTFSNFTVAPSDVVAHEVIAWTQLYQTGIRNFLLPDMPDMSVFPVFKGVPAATLQTLKQLSDDTNVALRSAIQTFSGKYPDVTIWTFTTIDFFKLYEANIAPSLGITDVTDACVTTYNGFNPPISNPTVCPNPSNYLWWDGFHYETKTHKAISDAFAALLGYK